MASFITAYPCTAQNQKGKEIQALIFTYAQGVHRVERKALSPPAVLSFSCLWVFQSFYLIYYIFCLAKFILHCPETLLPLLPAGTDTEEKRRRLCFWYDVQVIRKAILPP